jgi:hypothetical protein
MAGKKASPEGSRKYRDQRTIECADVKSRTDLLLTMPITNQLIETHLESIADAIVAVARERSK